MIEAKGGLAISHQGKTDLLPLPIARLMSLLDGDEVAVSYSDLEIAAKALGSELQFLEEGQKIKTRKELSLFLCNTLLCRREAHV